MKRNELLAALAVASGLAMVAPAAASTTGTDTIRFRAAVETGSVAGLQDFLLAFPGSAHSHDALALLIKVAAGGEHEGNRGEDNPGRGYGAHGEDRGHHHEGDRGDEHEHGYVG